MLISEILLTIPYQQHSDVRLWLFDTLLPKILQVIDIFHIIICFRNVQNVTERKNVKLDKIYNIFQLPADNVENAQCSLASIASILKNYSWAWVIASKGSMSFWSNPFYTKTECKVSTKNGQALKKNVEFRNCFLNYRFWIILPADTNSYSFVIVQ